MAESNRSDLLSAVNERDVDALSNLAEKLHNGKSLADTLVSLGKRQLSEIWDGVLSMCMSSLMESDASGDLFEEHENVAAKTSKVLLCITRLATATLSALKQDKGVTEVEVPQSLHETAIILHGIMPTLPSDRSGLKNSLCLLFEAWWGFKLAGREELMTNTLVYLLDRSTQPNAAKVDVSRVMAVHEVLLGVDFDKESADGFKSLLLKCCYQPHYVTTPQGSQFLAFLLTLNTDLTKRLHDSIKNHLPSVPVGWGSKYGEIYFRAWQKSAGEDREYLEIYCIQDLMTCACRMKSDNSLWHILFKILKCLHSKKTQRGVEEMLFRLYEPILWRFLKVCNSNVRLSSAHVMFSAFPLQSSSRQAEDNDAAMQRQFDVMHSLLQDPVPAVRVAAIQGVGRVLSIYWELIPTEVVKCFMSTLVEKLAYDISSPQVREAVIKTMFNLCDNHLAVPLLTQVLPTLKYFIHDTSERVRRAVLDLLLKLKGLRAIKFYNVVPVTHLLGRLDIETNESVVRRLMQLLHRSFVPAQGGSQEQLERCKALIMSNPGAARQFYLHLHEFLDQEELVAYMVVLCRYLVEKARHLKSYRDQQNNEDPSHDYSHAEDQQAADTPRRSGRSSAKKKKNSKGKAQDEDTNQEEDEGTTDGTQDQQQQVLSVLRGVMEAVYLMYITVASKLASNTELQPMGEGLAKKISVTVREVMTISQDAELDTTLIALAGYLPSRALPLASQTLMNKLRRAKPGHDASVDVTTTVKALVQWGKTDILVEMVKEILKEVFGDDEKDKTDEGETESVEKKNSKNQKRKHPKSTNEKEKDKEKPEDKQQKSKKKVVGFSTPVEDDGISFETGLRVVETMLDQCECWVILQARHRPALMSLATSLHKVVGRLQVALSPVGDSSIFSMSEDDLNTVATAVRLYKLHLRLCSFLACETGDKKKVLAEHQGQNGAGATTQGCSSQQSLGNGGTSRQNIIVNPDSVYDEATKYLVRSVTWAYTILPWLRKGSKESVSSFSAEKNFEKNLEKKKFYLRELIVFTLKITSSVMMAGKAGTALLDEAIQLCTSVISPERAGSTTSSMTAASLVHEHELTNAALGCVYQLLSVRTAVTASTEDYGKGGSGARHDGNGGGDTQITQKREKERYAEVACSCICSLFKSLALSNDEEPREPSSTDGNHNDEGEENEEEEEEKQENQRRNNNKGGDKKGRQTKGKSKGDKTRPSAVEGDNKQDLDLVKNVSPLVSELILELTRRGRSETISQRAVVSAVDGVKGDVTAACKKESLDLESEEVVLPPFSTMVVSALKKRPATFKSFCTQLESSMFEGEGCTVYQAQALVAIFIYIHSSSTASINPAAVKDLKDVLEKSSRPTGMDEDVFKDVQSSTWKRLEKLRAETINVD